MKTRKAGDDAECQLVGSTRRTTAFCPATISTLIPFIDHFAWTCPRMTYDTFGAIGPPCVSVSRIVVGGGMFPCRESQTQRNASDIQILKKLTRSFSPLHSVRCTTRCHLGKHAQFVFRRQNGKSMKRMHIHVLQTKCDQTSRFEKVIKSVYTATNLVQQTNQRQKKRSNLDLLTTSYVHAAPGLGRCIAHCAYLAALCS